MSVVLDLRTKNALVCGSTQGIGWAIAQTFALAGANVTLLARNESSLMECVGKLHNEGEQVHSYLVADFDDIAALGRAIQTLEQPIHILVNNTGGPAGGALESANLAAFEEAFRRHLLANHTLVQAVLPAMKQAEFGRIINIISTSVKQPLPNLGVSNTIRAAVGNWAKTLATELASSGITVNNVLPGATKTARLESIIAAKAQKTGKSTEEVEAEMRSEIPMKRFATPNEIASAALFLASPLASYITGTNIVVDGGRTGNL